MGKRKRNIYLIIVLLVIFIIFGLYFVLCKYNERVLRKEIKETINMEIDSNYKVKCKTIFGYRDVEEAIKDYLNNYSIKLDKIKTITKDKEITSMLSVDNYKKDGPKFEKSLKYLNDQLKAYDNEVDSLIEMSDKEYLNNYINKYTKSKKYIKLYKEIIDDLNVYEEVDNSDELKANKKSVDSTIKVTIDILKFLKENGKAWKIENNVIKFNNYKLLNKYNAYLKKLK